MDFWDGDILETITSHIGPILKVDDLTVSLTMSKYARVCLEIHLSKLLCLVFGWGMLINVSSFLFSLKDCQHSAMLGG